MNRRDCSGLAGIATAGASVRLFAPDRYDGRDGHANQLYGDQRHTYREKEDMLILPPNEISAEEPEKHPCRADHYTPDQPKPFYRQPSQQRT